MKWLLIACIALASCDAVLGSSLENKHLEWTRKIDLKVGALQKQVAELETKVKAQEKQIQLLEVQIQVRGEPDLKLR